MRRQWELRLGPNSRLYTIDRQQGPDRDDNGHETSEAAPTAIVGLRGKRNNPECESLCVA